MNKTYQVRIVLSVLAFILILSWDFFYYLGGYQINWPLDLAFTVLVLTGIWVVSGYVDRLNLLVSDLNKREKEAHELTERLNRITDNLQEIVFETNEKGEIIFLNQAWTQMTGYDIDECLGTMYNQYFDQEERVVQHLLSVIKEHKDAGRVELQLLHKEGKKVWGDVHYKLYFDEHHQFTGGIGTVADITKQKQAKLELERSNQQLQMQAQKLAVAGQIAAGIAHEVRNPLTSVNGFLQLMKTQYPERTDYFDIIFSEIKRIDFVLSELLVLAKPQAVHFQEVQLHELLEQVITLLKTNAVLSNIDLKQPFKKQDAGAILADANQMKQLFINLIKNAIEAMPEGGSIYISTEKVLNEWKITIQDEGKGMSEEDIQKIYDPFFSTKKEGTGLGLTICATILKDHHGRMDVSSELGKGAAFQIYLPVCQKSRQQQVERT
ncbi:MULTISPECIES: ATP-binding protein [Bacillus]|uniref:histidine kinase n=1 Tax=Bacillus pumilus TaxID=1408 RepID=A0AAE4B6D1_BACPU|nr:MULTISPECIES: ATP-binding protein [Bacillus]AOC56947.1 PAS domain-containing sensor histidine kinase [Bacillus pumilus]AZV52156.1 PAS domain-containing sensor histidine kinase [Bacillus pumilus]MBR0586335.1 PAS domain S-box protein [Bacillus pumilus DW2J2]MBR0618769.1 PAS domain S-box protein [Bacillus pumilus]MBR0621530.1 PAS domain S-box protein [Bacillus pumilus]